MLTKEEIIKELQKYAKENGGKTPGEQNFYKYVGIGIYDLQKRGWSKYRELVLEAGLVPNKFDKTKYSHKQLCEMFIETIRKNGKWPTRGELNVEHYNNSNLPDSSTYYNKLGLTRDLAQTILQYVKDKKGYEDVIVISNSVLEKHKNESVTSGEDEIESGFIYLGLQHGDHKIGFAKNLDRRREDITLLGSEPMVWIHKIETDDMRGVERYWHNRFKSKWLRGEWFKLNSADVKAFKRWKRIF